MRKQYIAVVEIECTDAQHWQPQDVALAIDMASDDVRDSVVYSALDDLLDDYRDGVQDLAAAPRERWIAVTERLPEAVFRAGSDAIVSVLVCTRHGMVGEALYYANRPQPVFEFLGVEVGADVVAAWRPLPAPMAGCGPAEGAVPDPGVRGAATAPGEPAEHERTLVQTLQALLADYDDLRRALNDERLNDGWDAVEEDASAAAARRLVRPGRHAAEVGA